MYAIDPGEVIRMVGGAYRLASIAVNIETDLLGRRTRRVADILRFPLRIVSLKIAQPAVGQCVIGIGCYRLSEGFHGRPAVSQLKLRVADVDHHDRPRFRLRLGGPPK